ncbi:hypothetical protein CMUS01_11453 [Colletotrichum musicola]|uniref:Uncharacterized protein n=1 Tax=Colletotrichum musicola TaxID=2175873 RepID=A0A8H6JXT0_9PEZI|nr:hypothetical protein CMUS01_11453 [Colletotrichum musicola]
MTLAIDKMHATRSELMETLSNELLTDSGRVNADWITALSNWAQSSRKSPRIKPRWPFLRSRGRRNFGPGHVIPTTTSAQDPGQLAVPPLDLGRRRGAMERTQPDDQLIPLAPVSGTRKFYRWCVYAARHPGDRVGASSWLRPP